MSKKLRAMMMVVLAVMTIILGSLAFADDLDPGHKTTPKKSAEPVTSTVLL